MIWTPSSAARIVLGLFTRIVARIVRSEQMFKNTKTKTPKMPTIPVARIVALIH